MHDSQQQPYTTETVHEIMARNVNCETVMNPMTGTASKDMTAPELTIWCPKQAVKLVDCFLGDVCMFYPRKHKHALCLEHFDGYTEWRKSQ